MAAHLKKPFNPAFCDYKAHPNKYMCDFFSLPQCRETFGRQDFLFFWNIMRTLECVLKINWFVSTILEAWCYWIMEKTAIHIAYSWNKWGNFQKSNSFDFQASLLKILQLALIVVRNLDSGLFSLYLLPTYLPVSLQPRLPIGYYSATLFLVSEP